MTRAAPLLIPTPWARCSITRGVLAHAVNSKQDALKTFQDLKDRTIWMAEIQGGYGESLILAGRGEEAKTYLNDALSLARELKNDGLVAQTLGFQGDAAYYRGDSKSARALYEQALQAATRSKEPDRILTAKVEPRGSRPEGRTGAAGHPQLASTDAASGRPGRAECVRRVRDFHGRGHDPEPRQCARPAGTGARAAAGR